MKMLIVEDNNELRLLLEEYFAAKSFAVDVTASGTEAVKLAHINAYDIVLLDYILPDKNGLQVCQEIRAVGKTMPILLLSVQASVVNKVTLLNAGADDYVEKPFSFEEVSARVVALLRRPKNILESIITIGPLSLDTVNQVVTIQGTTIYFTSKEYALLEFLLRNKHRLISRSMILDHVWSSDSDPLSNTIEAHIFNVRKKIRHILPGLIKTVPGRGYRIEENTEA